MCFYVYAPLHSITLKHVSEKIWPCEKRFRNLHSPFHEWNGTSRICIDIVIANDGHRDDNASLGSPIDKFFIIYPNTLYDYDKRVGPPDFKRGVDFEDITLDLMASLWDARTDFSKLRQVLEKELILYVDEAKIFHEEIHPDNYDLMLRMPDPNSLKPEPFSRYCIKGKVNVQPIQKGSIPNAPLDELYNIMESTSTTMLECKFTTPLEPGEDRWIRFNIFPKSTSSTESKLFGSRLVDIYRNENSYRYEIKGPYNVLYEFFSKMESFQASVQDTKRERIKKYTDPDDNIINKIPYEDRLMILDKRLSERYEAMKELGRHIDYHNHPTKIVDWRLLVFENNGAMTGIREYGIYRISGSFSQVIHTEWYEGRKLDFIYSKHDRVYIWKTGWKNVCPHNDGFKSFFKPKISDETRVIQSEQIEGITKQCPEELRNGCGEDQCIPYIGNFKIAYSWTKKHKISRLFIIVIFVLSLVRLGNWLWDKFFQ